MKSNYSFLFIVGVFITMLFLNACGDRDDDVDPPPTEPIKEEATIIDLLTNQVDEIIIPSMTRYSSSMSALVNAAELFNNDVNEDNYFNLIDQYLSAYRIYQIAAVHNYFATANQSLVTNANLYPVDTDLLLQFIANESYNFNTTAQQRANGFPAIDFLLYGNNDPVQFFADDPKVGRFLVELVNSLKSTSDNLVTEWTGSLRDDFINNGGTALGSSVSVQLNEAMNYYEEHVRENKVGIPIGRLGPNDTPIAPDGTKIEAYYQSLVEGNDNAALNLLRESIQEVEDLYTGTNDNGIEGPGYDDLLIACEMESLDQDIKAQFEIIFDSIDSRNSITGDDELYNAIQEIVTLFKSDLFPVLNIQDADGANDGD